MVKHAAFTMIELVFAIVIISIAVISLPMMTQINAKGLSENIKQEAIFIASAKLMQVLSFPWDKRAIDANNTFDSAKVVDLGLAGSSYGRKDLSGADSTNSIFRIGHVRDDLHRRFFNYNDNNITHNSPSVGIGIEDQTTSSNIDGDRKIGYKNRYKTTISVSYVNDSSAPDVLSTTTAVGQTNLKLVEVKVEDNSTGVLDTVVLLRSYVANIGEVDYFSRIY